MPQLDLQFLLEYVFSCAYRKFLQRCFETSAVHFKVSVLPDMVWSSLHSIFVLPKHRYQLLSIKFIIRFFEILSWEGTFSN